MTAAFGAALSTHPVAADAIAEVVGDVLERVGPGPDLAVLVVGARHEPFVHQALAVIDSLLAPECLIGCTAAMVAGGGQEIEDGPALALWAARHSGVRAAGHVRAHGGSAGFAFGGLPGADAFADGDTLLLLGDPFSFPTDALLDELSRSHPGSQVIGGMASAGQRPGQNALLVGGSRGGPGIVRDGAAVAVLPAGSVVGAVSQGCRPIGQPFTVTRADGQLIHELAGRPALERLMELIEALPTADRVLAAKGLHLGRVIDEHKVEYGPGDFLIRNVLGGDREHGVVAVGDEVPVGATVQFQVRDAESAHAELTTLAQRRAGSAAGLLFTCNGRGTNLFDRPNHDAATVQDAAGPLPLAGMSCAGEIGPVGPRSFVHGFTASLALFPALAHGDRPAVDG